MHIEISRKFQKQVKACKDRNISSRVLSVIEAVNAADNMGTFPNLKKLTRYKDSYSIRMGEYRIGIFIESDNVIFAAFDHRSDIYKYFP
jgi:mRNA interferase RelE/StbE